MAHNIVQRALRLMPSITRHMRGVSTLNTSMYTSTVLNESKTMMEIVLRRDTNGVSNALNMRMFGTNAFQPDLRKQFTPTAIDEEPLYVHADEGEHSGADSDYLAGEVSADESILSLFRAEEVVTETDRAYFGLIQTLARCRAPEFRQNFPVMIHPLLRKEAREFLSQAETPVHFATLAKCVRVSEDFDLYAEIMARATSQGLDLNSDFYGEVLPAFTHARKFDLASEVYTALTRAGGAWTFATYDAAVDYLFASGDIAGAEKMYREGVAKGVLKLWVPSTEGHFYAQKLLKGNTPAPHDRTQNYGSMLLLDGLSQNACYVAMRLAIQDIVSQQIQVNTLVVQTGSSQRAPLEHHLRMAKNMAGLVNNISQFMDAKDGYFIRAPQSKIVSQLPEFVIQRLLRGSEAASGSKTSKNK